MNLTELQKDEIYHSALLHQLELWMNFTEISLAYGHWNACRIFSDTIRKSRINRDSIFITNSIYPRDFSSFDEVNRDIELMYEIFSTSYFDSTLITQSLCAKFWDTIVLNRLHELLDSWKTRFVSISNGWNLFIDKMSQEFWDKLIAHETNLSFEARVNQDEGIFENCKMQGIENIIWRPLRRNATNKRNRWLLNALAEKYNKTTNQIILNWISTLWLRPMVMSSSIKHIDENWSSTSFVMNQNDVDMINDYRVPWLQVPKIDRDDTWDWVDMISFVINIDDYL